MNEQLQNKFNEETIDLVINAAYGSVGLFKKIKVWFLIKENAELRELYNDYRSTAQSVHTLSEEVLPDNILRKVETETGTNLTEKQSSFIADLTSIIFEKPQIIFVTSAIVIGLIISSMFFEQSKTVNTGSYSVQEVQLANKQAKEALAIVSRILNSTQATLTEEIIPNRVVKPINESFEYVNDLLNKGDI